MKIVASACSSLGIYSVSGLSFPLTEIFEVEYRVLRPRAPLPPLDIRFRRFTSLNTTIRLREGKLLVRLSDLLESAPESVHHAIAHILLAKLYKKPIAPTHADRRCVHSREFQAEERLFPELQEAKAYLKRI